MADRTNCHTTFLLFGFTVILLLCAGQLFKGGNDTSYIINAFAQTDNSPGFQDSYWTDNLSSIPGARQTKVEVGPGEGSSTLAIVLVNKARQDITGVKGVLTLPDGFEAAGIAAGQTQNNGANTTGSQFAAASLKSIVKAGDVFTLYFDINTLDTAKIGQYSTSLKLVYSKILEIGNIETVIPVQFRLPGKVTLDASILSTETLIPGTINKVPISIRNIGSTSANSVTVSLNGISSGNTTLSNSLSGSSEQPTSSVTLGSTTFDVGSIASNGSKIINTIIYPSFDAGGKVQNLNLQISYGDAYGNPKRVSSLIGLVVAPKPPESVISLSTNDNVSSPSKRPDINATVNKNGVQNAVIITAGQIQDLDFVISNNSSTPVSNLVITLNSPSDSVKIIGNSKWTLNTLRAQADQAFTTKVFAAKSAVGNPILFNLGLNYIFNGDTKTDSLDLGAYVTGQFKIRAYDFNVTTIGDTPNLVANLLNEGNSLAMFTTVEMINDPSQPKHLVNSLPPPQYLGDLDENSPLPVSIPLNMPNKVESGTYPVSLRVTYKDDLRIEHSTIVNGTVLFQQKAQTEHSSGGLFGSDQDTTTILPGVIAVIAIIAISVMIYLRRRRRSKLKIQLEQSQNDDLALDMNPSFAEDKKESHEKKEDQSSLQK